MSGAPDALGRLRALDGRGLHSLEGEWDLVTDCETAGPLGELVKERGLDDRLTVRAHPWVPVGEILAMRPEESGMYRLGG